MERRFAIVPGDGIGVDVTRETVKVLDRLGIKIGSVDTEVTNLSGGQRQAISIGRAVYFDAKILIMDEPTAVLTPQETKDLFNAIHKLVDQGKTVIFITHKLREVKEISDRVTVMRLGKMIGTHNTKDVTREQIANMMVGREVFLRVEREKPRRGDVLLAVQDIYVTGEKEQSKLRGVSLEVRTSR